MFESMFSAPAWFFLSSLVGVGLTIAGVREVFGHGWSLIAGGVASLGFAALIARGLSDG